MKKLFLVPVFFLFTISFVNAYLFDSLESGGVVEGVVQNTYSVDDFLFEVSGEEIIFETLPMRVHDVMYFNLWVEDSNKDFDLWVYNYDSSSWVSLPNGINSNQKMFVQNMVNMTGLFSSDNAIRLKFVSSNGNGRVSIDKFIISGSPVSEGVMRVEQVDTVSKIVNQTALSVFGTEYQVHDDARIFLQLVEGDNPVTNASCLLDVFYPDMVPFQVNAPMNKFNNGLYYYDFVVPNMSGVYMLNVFCNHVVMDINFNASAFNIVTGTLEDSGTVDKTFVRDDDRLKIKDVGDVLEVNFTFPVNSSDNSELSFFFEGKLKYKKDYSTGLLVFKVFNGSNNSWFNLSNSLMGQKGGSDQTINNWLENINISDLLVNGDLVFKLEVINGSEIDKIEVDYLQLVIQEHFFSPTNQIRGGGEVHVSDYIDDLNYLLSNLSVDLKVNYSFSLINNISLSVVNALQNFSLEETSFLIPGGTEYVAGDNGKVWVQYFKGDKTPILDGNCSFVIYNPNNSIFINDSLSHFNNGLYDHDFVVPNMSGVYPVEFYCFKEVGGGNVKFEERSATELHILLSDNTTVDFSPVEYLFETFNNTYFVWYNSLYGLMVSSYNNLSVEHDYTQSLITSSYNNLTVDISGVSSQVSNLDSDIVSLSSDLVSHDSDIKDRLDDLELKIDLVLDKLNIHLDAINLDAVTHDCLEGSVWSIDVTAFDSFENYLNNVDIECNITTNLWGGASLIWDGDSFDYSHECGYGNETITWVVNCEEI